ncbi:MAG: rod shape-determining protein RodA [Gammaproteobacteria bacterium RIFCSPHIGHO2_12_FULL_35_23]|nr:MAG: rod shape-determining protein RodA [Gammaproteobacteria bacterium RIFCSPHIGHO2_12_FULL_35_23]
MSVLDLLRRRFRKREVGTRYRTFLQLLHVDLFLLITLLLVILFGFFILYSAGNEHIKIIIHQIMHILGALLVMLLLAQIPPWIYERWSPGFYAFSLITLLAVLIMGKMSLGAQRWLSLGIIRFQPSELMKLAIPMLLAWFFANRELPPKMKDIGTALLIIFIPAAITMKEPDLGSAIILIASGGCILLLAGLSWRLILSIIGLVIIATPFLWHFMHGYQKQRILTFLNPERDPLGAGYHIIQSKIAIGSGGFLGKGWLQGTQSHLHFLPEHTTDFIFAVSGEEFGFIGCTALLILYLIIVGRCLSIALKAQNTYTRLLAGSLGFLFFISVFINMGMVIGLLPVVGLPLPLVSYGGTSMITILASFGILMSIHGHKNLL